MPRKSTVKAAAIPAAQSRDEAEAFIARIGMAQRQFARIEAEMNDEMAGIKARYAVVAQPYKEEIDQLFAAVHTWAEANRVTLLKGKAKSVELSTGVLSWRISPPRVLIRGAEAVLEHLQRFAPQFVRTKSEIDKEALLADADAAAGIKGITITQQEEFRVKPFESELEKAVTQKVAEAA